MLSSVYRTAIIKNKAKGEEAFKRLPINLQNTNVPTEDYKVYLIIHGHKIDWLLGLVDALREALREEVKKWNLRDSNIKVFNEETALENHLIVAYIPVAEITPLKQANGNADEAKVQEWFDQHS